MSKLEKELKDEIKQEKMNMCYDYFNKLADALKDSYEVVSSISNDKTLYLVMKGTENDLSYYGKPMCSFRVSDRWNWFASLKKCKAENHVQCFTKDLHRPFKRRMEGKHSRPIMSSSVGYYGIDRQYHIIFGEIYDKKTKNSLWISKPIEEVVNDLADDILDKMYMDDTVTVLTGPLGALLDEM